MSAETASVTISPRQERKQPAPDSMVIPALLHQTFKTMVIPLRMHDAAMSWVGHNPAFEYSYHDNESCRSFLEKHFDADTVAAYDKLTYGAFKADLWRYCQLYVTGGVYADIDTICRTDLTEIIGPADRFIVPLAGGVPYAVFNAFIASVPRHPFLEAAVRRAVRLVLETPDSSFDGYMMTGPGCLGQAMNVALGRDPETDHEVGRHDHDGQIYRILDKRRDTDGERKVFDGDRVVFDTKYDGYLDDLSSTGAAHWAHGPVSMKRRVKRLAKRVLAPFRI